MAKALIIDITKCTGCYNCSVACKDEFVENDWLPYSKAQPDRGHDWMKVTYHERGQYPKVRASSIPVLCMHCDDAPCMKAATGNAVYKRPDGIVIIDPVKSVGQKQLVASCPYGVIYWNQELNIPQKCTLCVHRLEEGKGLKCALECPVDAITYGEYEDLKKTIDEGGAVLMNPEFGAKPRVYYIGMPKTFITGALVDSKGECLAGADVTAKDTAAAKIVASTKSDAFGDFWLDGLDAKKTYEVAISAAGKTKTVSVSLDKDTDLGDIQL